MSNGHSQVGTKNEQAQPRSTEKLPLASLSLDLDDKWSYMKTHGDPGWAALPTYLPTAIPRILEFLEEHELKITFFVVGQDAALESNRELLQSIARAGHEIANHSFEHDACMKLRSEAEMDADLALAEEHIERATGQKPVGFRAPGFSFGPALVRVLARRGYLYDASAFPSVLNPLARAYFMRTSNLKGDERRRRQALYGTLGDGFRPLNPYRWRLDGRELLELSVTTLPLLRLPIHFSYLLYFSSYSRRLTSLYFQGALRLCRLRHTQPSLLLHTLDFIGADDTPDLAYFPAMRLPTRQKLEVLGTTVRMLSREFSVRSLREHAMAVSQLPHLPVLVPALD
jgi:peptidoglycan/xylan/chitin deacetylase (PgdA/CDA1 family)